MGYYKKLSFFMTQVIAVLSINLIAFFPDHDLEKNPICHEIIECEFILLHKKEFKSYK